MRKALMFSLMALMVGLSAAAADFKTFENEKFTINYPADWEVSFYGDELVNITTEDDEIRFDVSSTCSSNWRRCTVTVSRTLSWIA